MKYFCCCISMATELNNNFQLFFPFEKVFIFPMAACVFQISAFTVMMLSRIWRFYLMSAAHKICSTKLNSNKMPSQIYFSSVCHLLFYILYLHCAVPENIHNPPLKDWNFLGGGEGRGEGARYCNAKIFKEMHEAI